MVTKERKGTARSWAKASCGALLAILILALFPIPVAAAITDPDVMEVDEVCITRHLYETDDMLLTFHYAISWTLPENQPEEPASETFIFRLMDQDETEILGYAIPYPYVYNGYGEGVGSMYWDAVTAPTWGINYILWLMENPGLDPNPEVVKRSVTSDNYCPLTTKEENQSYLRDYLIDIALDLELAWGVEPGSLIGDNNYLTAAGETYFQGAIPGLRIFCPDIFAIKEVVPQVDEKEWTLAQQTAAEQQWEGTWVQDSLEGLSELFGGGVGWSTITGIGCVILFLVILVFSHMKFKNTKPGLLLGILPVLGGAVLGFIPYVIVGLTCFGGIMFLAYTFWFKGAT